MLEILKSSFQKVVNEYNSGLYDPISEDDFLTRTYHQLLETDLALSKKLFVKSSILLNIPELNLNDGREKYDLAIGQRISGIDSKGKKKVWVSPELLAEFKIYSEGFSSSTKSRRRYQAQEDIDKLTIVKRNHPDCIYSICIFDAIGWLYKKNQGENISRLSLLINHRNEMDKQIKVIIILPNNVSKNSEVIEL